MTRAVRNAVEKSGNHPRAVYRQLYHVIMYNVDINYNDRYRLRVITSTTLVGDICRDKSLLKCPRPVYVAPGYVTLTAGRVSDLTLPGAAARHLVDPLVLQCCVRVTLKYFISPINFIKTARSL